MLILVLEDDPHRIERFEAVCKAAGVEVDITTTAAGCIEQLETEDYDTLFLDHDLGGEAFVSVDDDNTGSAVARWMSLHSPKIDTVIIHSMNSPAANGMKHTLEDSGYWSTHYRPWLFLTHELPGIIEELKGFYERADMGLYTGFGHVCCPAGESGCGCSAGCPNRQERHHRA